MRGSSGTISPSNPRPREPGRRVPRSDRMSTKEPDPPNTPLPPRPKLPVELPHFPSTACPNPSLAHRATKIAIRRRTRRLQSRQPRPSRTPTRRADTRPSGVFTLTKRRLGLEAPLQGESVLNTIPGVNSFRSGPNERGRFGEFGGRFRRRNADAADPGGRARLQRGEGRSGLPRRTESII